MNFYAILGFFPLMLNYLYSPDPITVGIRGMSYSFAILGGASGVSFLISHTRGHVRMLFTVAAVMMGKRSPSRLSSTPFYFGFN